MARVTYCPRSHEWLRLARKGLPPAARPQGPAAHDATARGNRSRPGRRWRLPVAKLQGRLRGQGCHWQERPPAGAAPARGDAASPRGAARRQQCLPQGRLPKPTACSTATCTGSGGGDDILLSKRRGLWATAQADGDKERAMTYF
ncbi:hypothetical protein BHM03_00047174 [Ensete ventricosum]|nr:hypothetical protein BHM03_00047174 [Ensete ventricosum]